ncbi:MAG: hypothetical protein ACI9IV_002396 [Paracoccaceae bacterium]|jgi:hypothetical protein
MSLDLHMATPQDVMTSSDGRLVDLVDGLLDHGVVIRGEIWLTVADIDLVFLGVDLVLASPGKMSKEKTK